MMSSVYMRPAEVMEMLGIGQKKAYEMMKKANDELAAKGFMIIRGRVPRKYFLYRLGIVPPDETVAQIMERKPVAHGKAVGLNHLQIVGGQRR